MKIFYKIVFIFVFQLVIFNQFSFSQNPLVKQWDKRFGGAIDDLISYYQQTTDGGYILGGSTNSGIGGDKTQAHGEELITGL